MEKAFRHRAAYSHAGRKWFVLGVAAVLLSSPSFGVLGGWTLGHSTAPLWYTRVINEKHWRRPSTATVALTCPTIVSLGFSIDRDAAQIPFAVRSGTVGVHMQA